MVDQDCDRKAENVFEEVDCLFPLWIVVSGLRIF